MSDIDFPHYGAVLHCGIAFDRIGIGATARSAGDGAFWAMMTPETFLDLATPLLQPRQSIGWLAVRIDEGQAIAPAELSVRMVANGPAAVSRHEGRHRMTILRDHACGGPVPVRISVCGHRDHEITDSLIGRVRSGLRAQRGGRFVPGPLFEDAEADLGGLRKSGIPPPAWQKSGMPLGYGAWGPDLPSSVLCVREMGRRVTNADLRGRPVPHLALPHADGEIDGLDFGFRRKDATDRMAIDVVGHDHSSVVVPVPGASKRRQFTHRTLLATRCPTATMRPICRSRQLEHPPNQRRTARSDPSNRILDHGFPETGQ